MENAHGCSDATNDKTGSCIGQALLAGLFGYIRSAVCRITISLILDQKHKLIYFPLFLKL